MAVPSVVQRLPSVRSIKACINTANFSHKHLRPMLIHSTEARSFNSRSSDITLTTETCDAYKRKENTLPLRSGMIAFKAGMTALYDQNTGKRTPCTVLQLDRTQVVGCKTRQRHGYFAVQVGAGWLHPSNVAKPMLGNFEGAKVSPKKVITEFMVRNESGILPTGYTFSADWFVEGQYVDARSNCRGHGFSGVMKRHGFRGQDRSHGVSLTHRSLGSAGPSQGGGSRVHPGKEMAGRLGNQGVTIQNLRVLKVDPVAGVIVVNGCLAGSKGCVVKLQDALKKSRLIQSL